MNDQEQVTATVNVKKVAVKVNRKLDLGDYNSATFEIALWADVTDPLTNLDFANSDLWDMAWANFHYASEAVSRISYTEGEKRLGLTNPYLKLSTIGITYQRRINMRDEFSQVASASAEYSAWIDVIDPSVNLPELMIELWKMVKNNVRAQIEPLKRKGFDANDIFLGLPLELRKKVNLKVEGANLDAY